MDPMMTIPQGRKNHHPLRAVLILGLLGILFVKAISG
jgi:hypothetical protein